MTDNNVMPANYQSLIMYAAIITKLCIQFTQSGEKRFLNLENWVIGK